MAHSLAPTRLSGEDLTFWWMDTPMQPSTMAMLMLLDRAPDEQRLRASFERAVAAVPRLAEHVVEAPLGIALPHWQADPTFDLEYHVRRHSLPAGGDLDELLREIAPVYETPFDRSRPLWEVRVYENIGRRKQAAIFFKLHHAVADGVGANAIFAALTDCERAGDDDSTHRQVPCAKGCWPQPESFGHRLFDAIRDQVELDIERVSSVTQAVVDTIRHPSNLVPLLQGLRSLIESVRFDSHSPLKQSASRARRLAGTSLPFDKARALKTALGGSMIDVILTVSARAMGKWYASRQITGVTDLMTLVPVNLRKPEDWALNAHVGNVATGLLIPLPIAIDDPFAQFQEVHARVESKKADPLAAATPAAAEWLSILPQQLFTWMAEASFGTIDFIVTNVPGILVRRYLAGAEIVAAYPFAPVALHSPVSLALYGYRDSLFIGLDADELLMPDVDGFKAMVQEAFADLWQDAIRRGVLKAARPPRRRVARRPRTTK